MQFNVSTNKRDSLADGGGAGDIGALSGSRLSFYQDSPEIEVSLEDFEHFALDRLRVLKDIEDAKSRGKKQDDIDLIALDLWRKHMRSPTVAESISKDIVSHFVLRLAYCRTADLQRWFATMETTLFRARFRAETPESQKRLLNDLKLPYKPMSPSEFESVKDKLTQTARSLNQPPPSGDTAFYKVPFEEVPELVGGRKVYLHRGSAFVARSQLASIVVGQFRSRLSKALLLTNRLWTSTIAVEEKERLTPVVESLSMRYLGADYTQAGAEGDVGLQNLDKLASSSFPPCMRHLFLRLREDHHLKFGGRQQLGLFLKNMRESSCKTPMIRSQGIECAVLRKDKGIGLKLEDSLALWKSEFSFKMTGEKFDKEYAYSLRHNYGREGKRADYTPYSCMKIISSTPGVGDHHGCPFRHFSSDNLRAILGSMQLNDGTVDGILEKVRAHHYQLACGDTFEAVHQMPSDGINHPNQYFELSQKLLQAEQQQNPQNVPPEPAAPASPVGRGRVVK